MTPEYEDDLPVVTYVSDEEFDRIAEEARIRWADVFEALKDR